MKDLTIYFIGKNITETNLGLFKLKADDFLNFLIKYEKASEKIEIVYEKELEEVHISLKSNKIGETDEKIHIAIKKYNLMSKLFPQVELSIDNMKDENLSIDENDKITSFTCIYTKYNYWYENNQSVNKIFQETDNKNKTNFEKEILTNSINNNNQIDNYENKENNDNNEEIKNNKIESPQKLSITKLNTLKDMNNFQDMNKIEMKENVDDECDGENITKRTLIYPDKEKNSFLDIDDFDLNGLIVILTKENKSKKCYVWKSPEFDEIDDDELNTYLIDVQEGFYGEEQYDDVEIINEIPFDESEEFFALF